MQNQSGFQKPQIPHSPLPKPSVVQTPEEQSPIIVVDGSNIAWEGRGDKGPDPRRLSIIYKQLEDAGYDPVIYVSAKFYHGIKQNPSKLEIYELMKEEEMLKVAPAAMHDDKIILDLATSNDTYFVSNDLFREFHDKYNNFRAFQKEKQIRATWLEPNQAFTFSKNFKIAGL